MATCNSTPRLTEGDGRQLAVDMLNEIDRWYSVVGDREWEKIEAGGAMPDMKELLLNEDPEILRRFIATVRDAKCTAVERGFLCVLTHALAQAAEDGAVGQYEDHVDPRPGLRWNYE